MVLSTFPTPSQDNLRWLKRQESLKHSRQRKVSNELSLASLSEEQHEDTAQNPRAAEATETSLNNDDDAGTERQEAEPAKTTENEKTFESNDDIEKPKDAEPEAKSSSEAQEEEEKKENRDNDHDDDGSVEAKELIYLQFIQDVTTDLLSTGRISERILTEIFQRHLEEFGEEKIPAAKADELQRQLKQDLGFGDKRDDMEDGLTKKLVRDMDALVVSESEEKKEEERKKGERGGESGIAGDVENEQS